MDAPEGTTPDLAAPPNLSAPAVLGAGAELALGYVPLADAAPLVVAYGRGLFRRHGLRVSLLPMPSWAAMRDRLALGVLDGGQVLAPMPLAGALDDAPGLVVPANLGLNGNTVTLGAALLAEIAQLAPALAAQRPMPAQALALALAARRQAGRPAPRIAVVFAWSSHNYLLRHWLAGGGIDPDRDLYMLVVPPAQVAARLQRGEIDGYCAGEPWGTQAVAQGSGQIVLASADIWPGHPEKLLAMSAALVAREPDCTTATIAALIEAGRWLDDPENREEAAHLLAAQALSGVPPALVGLALADRAASAGAGAIPRIVFHADHAGYPYVAHGAWWLGQMQRWGHARASLTADEAARLPARLWRPDLWRRAAALVGAAVPSSETPPFPPPEFAPTSGASA